MKICNRCLMQKNVDDFYVYSGKRRSTCKACVLELQKIWRGKNIKRSRAIKTKSTEKWRKLHPKERTKRDTLYKLLFKFNTFPT